MRGLTNSQWVAQHFNVLFTGPTGIGKTWLGHPTLEAFSYTPGTVGPVLGPFIGLRIWRDEIRVVTSGPEESIQRVGDWIVYDGMYFADAEIISAEQISTRRKLRLRKFCSELTEIP